MTHPKRVLMLSNFELGHSNTFLAVAHGLLTLSRDVEVHYGSFQDLEKRVRAVSEQVLQANPHAKPIEFYKLDGTGILGATMKRHPDLHRLYEQQLGTGFWDTLKVINSIVVTMMNPYTGPEYSEVLGSAIRVIKEVNPDVVVIDNGLPPAMAACIQTGVEYMVLSPNTLKDVLAPSQPQGAILWKYPFPGTGYQFPVPWYLIPLNIFFCIYVGLSIATNKRMVETARYVQDTMGTKAMTIVDAFNPPTKHVQVMVSNRPEIELPLDMNPQLHTLRLTSCGPILLSSPPIAEQDPDMQVWLARGPTVLVCLGTLLSYSESAANEMAQALLKLQSHANAAWGPERRLQILWKLPKSEGNKTDSRMYSGPREILRRGIEADSVRLVDWLKADPQSILQSGHVVLSVNHGGSSSFHEALCAAVPQVVLPQWVDCYDFASRAEYLGIGLRGNKLTPPRWQRDELGSVLVDALFGPNAGAMKTKVKSLSDICQADGGGRAIAVRTILAAIEQRSKVL